MAATPIQILSVKSTLLIIFHNIMAHYKRTYCWPTRATMVKMIQEKTGRAYSLSWIDKCLYWLNRNGYLISYFRPGTTELGRKFNRPSNRQITRKALAFMTKIGMRPARFLWNMSKKLTPPRDTVLQAEQKPRDPPEPIPLKPGESPFEDPEFRQRRGLDPIPPWKK